MSEIRPEPRAFSPGPAICGLAACPWARDDDIAPDEIERTTELGTGVSGNRLRGFRSRGGRAGNFIENQFAIVAGIFRRTPGRGTGSTIGRVKIS